MKMKISDLPRFEREAIEVTSIGDTERSFIPGYSKEVHVSEEFQVQFPVVHGSMNERMDLKTLVDLLRDEFSPGKAVITCKACGQWGARFCECKHCGSPIE